ncbi:MAG: PhzF family phenazine biosynthesis protein, partial [Paracoccaceae bacterium]
MPIETRAREGRAPLVMMTQPAPVFGRRYDPGAIAAIYGLEASDIVGSPQTVSTGAPFCIVRLGSFKALRAARLDAAALAAFKTAEDADFMEPFLHVTKGVTGEGETFARLLLPPPFPPEDPFTGSATGSMAAWLFSQGWIARRFIAEQGHDLGRPGSAEVELLGASDAIEGVNVAGSGVVVMRGEVDL